MIKKLNEQIRENLHCISSEGRDQGPTGSDARPRAGDMAGCVTSEGNLIAPFVIPVDPSFLSMWMVEGKEYNEHGSKRRARFFVLTGWVDALPDASLAMSRLTNGEYFMCRIDSVRRVASLDSVEGKLAVDCHRAVLGPRIGPAYDGVDNQTGLDLGAGTIGMVRDYIAGNLLGTEDDPDLVAVQRCVDGPGSDAASVPPARPEGNGDGESERITGAVLGFLSQLRTGAHSGHPGLVRIESGDGGELLGIPVME